MHTVLRPARLSLRTGEVSESAMSNRRLALVVLTTAILCFGGAIALAIYQSPPHNGYWTEALKQVAANVGIAAGLYAPLASIFMATYQSRLTRDIEVIKSSLLTDLEVNKVLLAGQVKAFDNMLTAANYYYFIIRQMVFAEAEKQGEMMAEADKRAAEASSGVWHLDMKDKAKWFEVYQRCIALAEAVRYAPQQDAEALFNDNAPALGTALEELEAAGKAVFAKAEKAA